MKENKIDSQKIINDAFDPIAEIYDSRLLLLEADKKFWIDLCRRKLKNKHSIILELGSGTGRISFVLADEGYKIIGIDLSKKMLEKANKILEEEKPQLKKRVQFMLADMTDFRFNEKFDLIILPFYSFAVLPDRNHQNKCLHCVKEHLSENGIFAFDLNEMILREDWRREKNYGIENSGNDYYLKSNFSRDEDGTILIHSTIYFFDKSIKNRLKTWKMRLISTTEDILEDMLKANGLEICEKIYNYDEIQDTKSNIYLVKHFLKNEK